MFCDSENLSIKLMSVIRMSWKGGFFRVAPRKHSAFIYRVSGRGVFTVDGKEIISNSGDVFFMPQNKAYDVDYTDGELIAFHFTTDEIFTAAENYSTDKSDKLYKMFMQAEIAYNSRCAGYKNRAVSLFYEILATLCECNANEFPPTISYATAYIQKNFKDCSLCVSDICHECGIGQTALRNNFRKYLKKSPVEYITELRLENARGLILTGASVERAAIDSGFCDPKYFSRLVKKHFGCTPKALNQYGR